MEFLTRYYSMCDFKELVPDRTTFVARVNKVMKSHKAQTVSRIVLFAHILSIHNKDDIDDWIMFAREKQVQQLVLGLECMYPLECSYKFPPKIDNLTFQSLQTLVLRCVALRESDMEQLLSFCPNVEYLMLEDSRIPGILRASGPSLKLKALHIQRCIKLTRVEIIAESLTFFAFNDDISDLVFLEAKNLVDLHLGSLCNLNEKPVDPCIFPQLYGLTLDARIQNKPLRRPNATFTNLRQLHLIVFGVGCHGLDEYISFVKASPNLRLLAIQVERSHHTKQATCGSDIENVLQEKVGNFTHSNLKAVIFKGFVGYPYEIQLAASLASLAVALSKMSIFFSHEIGPDVDSAASLRSWALEHVEKLKASLPYQVRLGIFEESSLPPVRLGCHGVA